MEVFQKESVNDEKYRVFAPMASARVKRTINQYPGLSPELANGKLEEMIQIFDPVTPSRSVMRAMLFVQPRLPPVRRILIRSVQDETVRSNTELSTTEENKYI